MIFSRFKTKLPTPEEALPGRAEPAFTLHDRHTVLGNPLLGPYPQDLAVADFGLGCFWGAERMFWQTPGVWTTLVGYQGGATPNPSYEEVCSGTDRPHRGGPGRLRPGAGLLRGAAEGLLGVPRPHPGLPAGQRRRHPVPVGGLHPHPGPGRRGRRVPRVLPGRPDRRGPRRDHHGDAARPARSTRPRSTTSSTWTRTPAATAASAAPGSPARWGSPVRRADHPLPVSPAGPTPNRTHSYASRWRCTTCPHIAPTDHWIGSVPGRIVPVS